MCLKRKRHPLERPGAIWAFLQAFLFELLKSFLIELVNCLGAFHCPRFYLSGRLWKFPALLFWLLFLLSKPFLLALWDVDRQTVHNPQSVSSEQHSGDHIAR